MRELAPLLAEDGFDIDNLDVPDMATFQAALARAVERHNMTLYSPVGVARDLALVALRSSVEAIAAGDAVRASSILDRVVPESPDGTVAEVPSCIGIALGILDDLFVGTASGATSRLGASAKLPAGHWQGERAAGDILALARKGRAFDSLGPLTMRQGGKQVFYGSILALTGACQARASLEGVPVADVVKETIR